MSVFWSKTIIFWKFRSEKFLKCRIFDILASPWKFSLHYLESWPFEPPRKLKKFWSNSTSRVWASIQKAWRQKKFRKTAITHVTHIKQIFKSDIQNQRLKIHPPAKFEPFSCNFKISAFFRQKFRRKFRKKWFWSKIGNC